MYLQEQLTFWPLMSSFSKRRFEQMDPDHVGAVWSFFVVWIQIVIGPSALFHHTVLLLYY